MNQDQQREFFKKTFTLQGRMFFPSLLSPETLKPEDIAKGKKPRYKVMFVWPKNSNQQVMAEIGAFINQAKDALHPSIPWQFFVNPVKDFDTYMRQDGKPNQEFTRNCYWVNATSNFEPVVVGPDRQPVISASEVYSGRNCVVNISFWNLDAEKKGISTNINAVMLLEGGAREGGDGVQVDPNQVFGQFQIDSGLIQQGGPAPTQGMQGNNPFGNPQGGQAPVGNGYNAQGAGYGHGQATHTTQHQAQPGHTNQGGYAQTASPSNPAQGFPPQIQQGSQAPFGQGAPAQGQVNMPQYGQQNNGSPFGV